LGTETGPDGKKMLKIQVAGSVPPGAKLEVFTAEGRTIPVNTLNGAFHGTALLKDRAVLAKKVAGSSCETGGVSSSSVLAALAAGRRIVCFLCFTSRVRHRQR
jgi:hypothetical protein